MGPCELTASITALANTMACRLTDEELVLLGVVFTQLGDTLSTIATRRSMCQKHLKPSRCEAEPAVKSDKSRKEG